MTDVNLDDFLRDLGSAKPTPGGGAVAALVGALAAGLAAMVCHLTIGKPRYAEHEDELRATLSRAEQLGAELRRLMAADEAAFASLSAAYQLPKDSDEERRERENAIQMALVDATDVPLRIAEAAAEVIELGKVVVEKGTRLAVSDAGMVALLGAAALRSAALNVWINLAATTDAERVAAGRARLDAVLCSRVEAAEGLYARVVAGMEVSR